MGDRVYLKLAIHGHIASVEAYEAIVKALKEDGLGLNGEMVEHRTMFVRALLEQDDPFFENFECNYANISAVELALQQHKVAYYVEHEAGSEFPGMCKSWTPERDMYEETCDRPSGEPCISLTDLQRAVDNAAKEGYTIEAWIRARLDAMNKASGEGLPTFSVADEVRALFAEDIARVAMRVAA